MRLRFWKKPRYFDFSKRRKPQVILFETVGAIIAAVWAAISSVFTSTTVIGVPIGGVVYGVGVAALAKFFVLAAVSFALSSISSSLSNKSGRQNPLSTGGLLQNTSMIIDPVKVIYGKQRVGGSQVFVHTEGGVTNPNLHVIVIWGEGPVNGIATDGLGDMIWLNDKRIQDYQTYLGQSWVYHEFHNGTMGQGVSSSLQTYFPQWADALHGLAYSYFRCTWCQTLYTSFPQFTAVIEGRLLFDPRDGSIAYSRNPALVWRDFKTHPRYGGGILGSLIDKQSVIDAANWFDSNSFYFDGTIAERKEFLENIEEILMGCRSEEIWSGGLYRILIQKYDTPVMSLTEKDIMTDEAGINNMGISTSGIQESPKRIKITFADPVNNYMPTYCYWPEASPYETETDKEWKEIILIGVADFTQALKMGKFFYNRTKYSTIFNFIAHPRVLPLEIGDMVYMSHDPAFQVGSIPEDWNNKILRVIGISITQNNQISLTLGDEDSSIYDTSVDVSSHTSYSTTLPSTTDTPEEPTNPSATTGEDTTTVARDDAYVDFQWDNMGVGVTYEIRYKKANDVWWGTYPVSDPGGMVDIPTKTGTGTLVMQASGNFTGASQLNYKVEIDGVGSPNTFKWSDDGGSSWDATGVAITPTVWQTLNNGVKVKFSATTGGVSGDNWIFTAKPKTPVVARLGRLPVDTEFFWQVCALRTWLNRSNYATPTAPIVTWSPTTGPSMADVSVIASSGGGAVFLEWTKDFEEPSLDTWLIYRNITNNSGTAVLIDEKSRQTRSYRDINVISGGSYYYWLKGRDRNGNVSANFSMVASIPHYHWETYVGFDTIGALPSVDGTIGYIASEIVALQNCDDYTQFSTDSAVSGSIEISQESVDFQEGTGSLRIKLTRYPKVRYFETGNYSHLLGYSTSYQYHGQSFKLTSAKDIKAIMVHLQKVGSPGDITAYIYNDSGGKPGSSLGSCTIAASSIPTGYFGWATGVFASPISLSGSTKYWLVLYCLGDASNHYYNHVNISYAFGDADELMGWGYNLTTGFGLWGYWDMLFRVCIQGDALNKYVYATVASKDISEKTYMKSSIKSINRTGGFLSHSFGESAIGEQNFAISITVANAWELKASDISAISAASRDGVTKIGLKVTNMDDDAEILWDNVFANIGEPFPYIRRGSNNEKLLTELPFNLALLRNFWFPHLLNNATLTYTERTTVGTTTLTVPSGKVWYLVHRKADSGSIYINDDLWWTSRDDFSSVFFFFDVILDDNDHIDLTLAGAGHASVWILELDEDPAVTPIYQTVTNASTYTVPADKILVIRRAMRFSSGTKLIVDNKDFIDLSALVEAINFMAIFDTGQIIKADASSVKFFGYLISKSI
jgi:hypothetical protein